MALWISPATLSVSLDVLLVLGAEALDGLMDLSCYPLRKP